MAATNYESAGVDYNVLDAAKRTALASAAQTEIKHEHAEALKESLGASAFVFRANGSTLATVLECLGTKSVVAREYVEAGGPDLFDHVGFDAVASVVNDLVSVGALPLVVNAYFATGSREWYAKRDRHDRLVAGWKEACAAAGAVWGGGESPTLTGLVNPDDIELAGSAVGFIPPGHEPVLGQHLAPGDDIVFIASTGLHANGASLVRVLVHELPYGYKTQLPSGREWGEVVLDKSAMYVGLVAELSQITDVRVTYYSHITGHGLRKLMRADKQLTYRIEELPLPVPEILTAIRQRAHMDDRTAYGTLNMGVGFAVFCAHGHGRGVVEIANRLGLEAACVGHVEEGPKRVVLEPVDVVFDEDELLLRHPAEPAAPNPGD